MPVVVDQAVVIKEVTKILLGASSSDCETLTHVKYVGYTKPVQRHPPRTVMGTTQAIGWKKIHKSVQLEFRCLGTIYHAVYHNGAGNVAYDTFTGDNPSLPYCKIFLADENGAEWTVTLMTAVIDGVAESVNDGEDMVNIIYVSAASMTPLTKT